MIVNNITAAELRTRLDGGDSFVILDVREPEEVHEFAIKPSIHIPLLELAERIVELEPHKNAGLVVYCKSGNRSTQACMFLELSGFTNVTNLRGGILAWLA